MEPFKYICHYWGKSSKSLTKGNDIHLLIYHLLLQIAGGINQSYCKILFAEMKCYQNRG